MTAELVPAPAVLWSAAAQWADRVRYHVATPDGWRPVTWRQHADTVRDVASWLRVRVPGRIKGERGVIFAENCVPWMEAALGLQAAGAVMVPVYPASTADQASYVITHCGAKVVFMAGVAQITRVFEAWSDYDGVEVFVVLDDTDVHDLPHAPPSDEIERRVRHWSRVCAEGRDAHEAEPAAFEGMLAAIDHDAPALMLYTSGTTGRPKGVPLTHENLGVNAADWLVCLGEGLGDDDVDLLWLPMSHVFGFGEACLGNDLGFTTYLSSPRQVLEHMPHVRPTVFMSVPAYWDKLAAALDNGRLAEATGGRLKFCLSGGAGLARGVKDAFAKEGLTIIEGYGLTECSPTLTLNRPKDFRFDSVGKPLPSVEVRLADDGEILARGPSVFSGYFRDEAATEAAFTEDGWFRTGDLGRFTPDGFLQIVGRKKDILVTAGGKNVAPGNVEALFATNPRIDHLVVYGDGKKFLVAGVWLAPGEDPANARSWVQTAIDEANEQLARCEQIKKFKLMAEPLTVEAGHLTSTLKLRRAKIYQAFGPQLEELYA